MPTAVLMRITKHRPITPRIGRSLGNAEMESSTPAPDDDEAMQAVLLSHVLDEHPTLLRRCDLVRELCQNPADLGESGTVDRAVEVLRKVGLLDRNGKYVLPTPPALHFYKLPRL